MTEDEIRAGLKPYNLKRVAELTCLPYVTLWRFATGKTKRPSWTMVERLREFISHGGKGE